MTKPYIEAVNANEALFHLLRRGITPEQYALIKEHLGDWLTDNMIEDDGLYRLNVVEHDGQFYTAKFFDECVDACLRLEKDAARTFADGLLYEVNEEWNTDELDCWTTNSEWMMVTICGCEYIVYGIC